jgi:hypothetical protein
LRLLAGMVLLDAARILLQARVTMEALVFSLKHPWRLLPAQDLEFPELSWDISLETA